MVRTLDFHSKNVGSIPASLTNKNMDYIIKDDISGSKDKKPYITGALPTLVEILLRHTNEKNTEITYFLTMDEFDFYRKNIEETAKKNW